VRFENKNIFFYFEKRSSLVQRCFRGGANFSLLNDCNLKVGFPVLRNNVENQVAEFQNVNKVAQNVNKVAQNVNKVAQNVNKATQNVEFI
jgi:hypothetical protein